MGLRMEKRLIEKKKGKKGKERKGKGKRKKEKGQARVDQPSRIRALRFALGSSLEESVGPLKGPQPLPPPSSLGMMIGINDPDSLPVHQLATPDMIGPQNHAHTRLEGFLTRITLLIGSSSSIPT